MNKIEIEERRQKIIEMRKAGKRYREIADAVCMDEHNLRKMCIRMGMAYTEGEAEANNPALRNSEKEAKRRIEEKCQGFEYVSGYMNNRSVIKIRCRKCGKITEVRYDVKHSQSYNSSCVHCKERERSAAKQEIEHLKALKRAERERERIPKAKSAVQTAINVCIVCGALFVDVPGRGGCSPQCRARLRQQKHDQMRRVRMFKASRYDMNITLTEVYQKDNGKCWLCGGMCDWSDSFTTEEGYFVAGDEYPSIDHVVPLSKGGLHTIDNVRLAHRGCNTKKGNKIYPLV